MATKGFEPTFSAEHSERIRRWQDNVYEEMRNRQTETVEYLGLTLTIQPSVQPITRMSDLLGEAVLKEVREADRVIDMGTGSGVNANLAAWQSRDVNAADIYQPAS